MFSLKQIAEIVEGKRIGEPQQSGITHFAYDTRKLPHTSKTLFIAFYGQNKDGHNFIKQAYNRGVRSFLVSKEVELLPEASFIKVGDTLEALQKLAFFYRRQLTLDHVVGITGSNGKTTIKEWLGSLLSRHGFFKSPQSYNSQLGVALSILKLRPYYKSAILEAGISQPNEMRNLQQMIAPSLGILTNIGQSHLQNFENKKALFLEKCLLFNEVEKILIHQDLKELFQEYRPDLLTKLVLWGNHPECDIQIDFQSDKTLVQSTDTKELPAFSIPHHQLENAGYCIAACELMGYSSVFSEQDLTKVFTAVPIRLDRVKGINDNVILNDAYSFDVTSFQLALEELKNVAVKGRKTIIVSEPTESQNLQLLWKVLQDYMRSVQVERVIYVGKEKPSNSLKALFSYYEDTKSLIQSGVLRQLHHQHVLVESSRHYPLDDVVAALSESNHQTRIEVNLGAIRHNYHQIKQWAGPNVQVMAMVKAAAYGASQTEIGKYLNQAKVDYLGVAYTEEGVKLREEGVDVPIMVMQAQEVHLPDLHRHQLHPVLFSLKQIFKWIELCNSFGYSLKCHVELETGMNRTGIVQEDLEEALSMLSQPNCRLEVIGCYSHLAASDVEEWDMFTNKQIQAFKEMAEVIASKLGKSVIKHISNTSGISRFPHANFNMVRTGIGLHGFAAAEMQKELLPSMRFITHINHIHQIEKGESIGYGRKGKATEDMRIATIPVGYADGLPRLLGNGNYSLAVAGHLVPIVGDVCMDMCMIDVTHVEVNMHDEVEIFGLHRPLQEMAKQAQTITYEILTGISNRVKRVFFED